MMRVCLPSTLVLIPVIQELTSLDNRPTPNALTWSVQDVTPAAVAELSLDPGREVWLTVKATDLEVGVEGAGGEFAGGAGEAPDPVRNADRDQEAGEDAEGDRAEHGTGAVAEEVDDAGGQQRHRGEGADQPEPDPDPSHRRHFTSMKVY